MRGLSLRWSGFWIEPNGSIALGERAPSSLQKEDALAYKKVMLWNSIVWAVALMAMAIVLKGSDQFITLLIILVAGAVASDAVIAGLSNPGRNRRS